MILFHGMPQPARVKGGLSIEHVPKDDLGAYSFLIGCVGFAIGGVFGFDTEYLLSFSGVAYPHQFLFRGVLPGSIVAVTVKDERLCMLRVTRVHFQKSEDVKKGFESTFHVDEDRVVLEVTLSEELFSRMPEEFKNLAQEQGL